MSGPVFILKLRAQPGTDGVKSFRRLLRFALRQLGMRAIDAREVAHEPEPQSQSQSKEVEMSAFSDRVRSQRKGMFKVADLEGDKELTLTISHLDEEMEMFGKTVDILNFNETGQQLQLNQTTAEWLIASLGDDPEKWPGKRVTLFLDEYEYNREHKLGIRLKLPDAAATKPASGDGAAVSVRSRKAELDDEIPF